MEQRSILITGGCGYLGSQLLRDMGSDPDFASYSIRVLDNMQRGSYRALFDLPATPNVRFLEADLLDPASLRFAMAGIETVVHLAAVVTTPVHFAHDRSMEQINHWGTAGLVSACIETGVRSLVYASSTLSTVRVVPMRKATPASRSAATRRPCAMPNSRCLRQRAGASAFRCCDSAVSSATRQ